MPRWYIAGRLFGLNAMGNIQPDKIATAAVSWPPAISHYQRIPEILNIEFD